jgi:hypothetical protein
MSAPAALLIIFMKEKSCCMIVYTYVLDLDDLVIGNVNDQLVACVGTASLQGS